MNINIPENKKRTTMISPLSSPLNTKMLTLSDQILLKLECGVDDYMYIPCVRTNHIKVNGKHVLEVFIQCHCQQLHIMKTICCRYVRQPTCLLILFRYCEIHFHQIGPFKLI